MHIEWNDSLKTGIPIIDEQHQELIVMLNRFGRFRCGRESFNEAFSELEDYVNIHFKTEEDYMISKNYPDYKTHKACHDELIELLKKFKEKNKNFEYGYSPDEEIIELAGDWIIEHYSKEDVELVKYIKQVS